MSFNGKMKDLLPVKRLSAKRLPAKRLPAKVLLAKLFHAEVSRGEFLLKKEIPFEVHNHDYEFR